MSEFHQLLTTVIGVAMAIIAVLGFNEKRKDRKARNFWEQRKEDERKLFVSIENLMQQEKEGIVADIKLMVDHSLGGYTTIKKNDEDNQELYKELKKIYSKVNTQEISLREFEKQYLATEIVRFANSIRSGANLSNNAIEHIGKSYTRYKEIGGNHYIDAEWEYIKEAMKNESN